MVFLWLSIVALIVGLWRTSRRASLLLVPYVLWVSVAAALNLATVELNGPFAGVLCCFASALDRREQGLGHAAGESSEPVVLLAVDP